MAITALRFGGAITQSVTDVKYLYALSNASNAYSVMKTAGDVAYQVPVGQTLYIVKILFMGTTANVGVAFFYGDTAVTNSAPAPTNSVRVSDTFTGQAVGYTPFTIENIVIPFPASKYPHMQANGAATALVSMWGFVV